MKLPRDTINDSQFQWEIEYPASGGGLAGGGMVISKEDPDTKWTKKTITDPASPFKTQYILELNRDIAEEFRKGEKAFADLFKFSVHDVADLLDPTKEHGSMAGANGFQTIKVIIWSPYP
jgi:hypothetical protein